MRARIRLAPPLRRSPSAPYPGVRRTDPRGSRSLWFWRQVSGSRRFNRGSGAFAVLIPTGPRWTSDFDTNAHHRRLFTAAAWRGLEPAPGSGLRRAFLHLSCSLCMIGQFIANLPFLRLRRTLDPPMGANRTGEGQSIQKSRREIVPVREGRLAAPLPLGLNHGDGRQAGKARFAREAAIGREPGHVMAYDVAPGLDAAMVAVGGGVAIKA